jgi:hypothetical protein
MNVFFLLLISITINSQLLHSGYVVTYRHEIYKVADNVKSPKIAIPEEYRAAIGKDSIEITDAIPLPYIMTVEMRINPRGYYSYKEWKILHRRGFCIN